jgi:hypothetical protein
MWNVNDLRLVSLGSVISIQGGDHCLGINARVRVNINALCLPVSPGEGATQMTLILVNLLTHVMILWKPTVCCKVTDKYHIRFYGRDSFSAPVGCGHTDSLTLQSTFITVFFGLLELIC